jgi:UDP-GlcNAc:undecaprenyl-phosphate/decaprenyl-phosphate GlcNAc-1-phosphate transferase
MTEMLIYLFVLIVAFIVALAMTPLAKWLGTKFEVLDAPGQRKIHDRPIPLTGGEAVYMAFAAALLLFGGITRVNVGIALIGLGFILFGLLDDAGIKMKARYKILTHLLLAALFIWFTGVHFYFFHWDIINVVLTACFLTFMTNSMNMLDGMDGLDAGVSFLAGLFFAIFAINSRQGDVLLIALALMGATLGFLRYNFNPASIFLGEAGSTFLGFILSVMAIRLNVFGLWDIAVSLNIERLQLISFIIPLIVLGIPIFDTYFVFANRFLHNIKFSQAGKDHSHHRIHLMGLSQRATVLTLYSIQIVLGFIALAMIQSNLQQFFALLAIVGVFFFGFTVLLSQVKVYTEGARDQGPGSST